MKTFAVLLLVAVLFAGALGCSMIQAGVVPPMGIVLTDIKAPLSSDLQGIKVGGSKTGMAEVKQYVWIVSTGDCSLEAAAKNAGITSVNYADYEYFSVLGGIFSRFAVVVHGD